MTVRLLDTHALIWALAGDDRLPRAIVDDLDRDPGEFLVSDVCFWEIAIKQATGKLSAADDLPEIVGGLGLGAARITRSQVWAVRELAFHHRDPFDRLLIVQAQALGVPIVSGDEAFGAYDVPIYWPTT